MVVPEKILMRKIKKREKVKKQLTASKQAEKDAEEVSVEETQREYNYKKNCFFNGNFNVILFLLRV